MSTTRIPSDKIPNIMSSSFCSTGGAVVFEHSVAKIFIAPLFAQFLFYLFRLLRYAQL